MRFQVVTFATPSYERLANRLGDSCKTFNIPLKIYLKSDQGDWVSNCALKSFVIRDAMTEFHKPIVFIDADAVVRSFPTLFNHITEDFAAHFRDWGSEGRELLSGTLFFNNTVGAKRLVSAWCTLQSQSKEWDQRVLDDALRKNPVSVYELPAAYTQIFDTMKMHGLPVIEHFQEGRKYRE